MQTFLGHIAEAALERFGERMDRLCVIFPTRRSKVFFTEELRKRNNGKLLFLPEMLTLDEFLENLSGYRIADSSEIGWHLLAACRQLKQELQYEPSEVLSFGNILVSDFNQTDLHLIDPSYFFNYLTEAKALEIWSPGKESLTEFQQNYLRFWRDTHKMYEALKSSLESQRICYQGMLYRMMAENQDALAYEKTCWLCGFNAFFPSETKIIQHLKRNTSVKLFLDVDSMMLQESNTAGKFIRATKDLFGDLVEPVICEEWASAKKTICATGCPGNVAQLQVVKKLTEQLQQQDISPVVVVHNHSLILPLCSELQAAGITFNVTGGIPVKNTIAYMLNDQVLHFWSGKLGKVNRELIEETLNELITSMGVSSAKPAAEITDWITGPSNKSVHEISAAVVVLFEKLMLHSGSGMNPSETAAIALLHQVAEGVKTLLAAHEDLAGIFEPHTFGSFFRQQVVHSKLQISGDALKGLQIMGLLETRNLDFSHVIHLSCNERNLPPDGHIPSFVPYDLQREAGWLMQNEREYIYAFHFFRSNQRAKNIYLLYNTETDELGSGEVSRFIRILKLYYTSRNPQITWSDSLAEFANYGSALPGNQIKIPKSPEVMQRVNEFLEKSKLSATSLNALRKCSLQFYFKYLSRIREPEKDEGFLSPTESGRLTHKVLEYAIISMVSRQIDKNALPLDEETILQLFAKAAKELFPEKDFSLGEGLMQKTFLCSNVKRILEITAAEDHGAYLRGNEVKGEKFFSVNGRTLAFVGTADRIQERDSVIEILDYKTGKLEKNDLKTQGWDSLGNHKKRDELFQLLLYAWLFFEEGKEVKPFIISIRSGEFTKLSAQVGGVESFQEVHMEMIETLISGLVSELLDEGIEFTQTPEKENCKFCDFNTLCKREDNEQAEDIAG